MEWKENILLIETRNISCNLFTVGKLFKTLIRQADVLGRDLRLAHYINTINLFFQKSPSRQRIIQRVSCFFSFLHFNFCHFTFIENFTFIVHWSNWPRKIYLAYKPSLQIRHRFGDNLVNILLWFLINIKMWISSPTSLIYENRIYDSLVM